MDMWICGYVGRSSCVNMTRVVVYNQYHFIAGCSIGPVEIAERGGMHLSQRLQIRLGDPLVAVLLGQIFKADDQSAEIVF